MTKKEIIYEIFEGPDGYIKNPDKRAWNTKSQSCEYVSENGNRCAVGSCLDTDEVLSERFRVPSVYEVLENLGGIAALADWSAVTLEDHEFDYMEGIDVFLDEKYHGHPYSFWLKMQYLHDNCFINGKFQGQEELEIYKNDHCRED